MACLSQTSTGLSVYVHGGLHKVLTLPATVLQVKNNSVTFLRPNVLTGRNSLSLERKVNYINPLVYHS